MHHLDSHRRAQGLHMKSRTRIHYTETDKALMWQRWRQGESLNAIARFFDRNHLAIGRILARTGGIQPPPRHRSDSGARSHRSSDGSGPHVAFSGRPSGF